MPSSSRSPAHSRKTSAMNIAITAPYGENTDSRRLSKASSHSPTTPRHLGLNRSDSISNDGYSGGAQPAGNGLGNLADELADAWDDDEGDGYDEEPDMNFQDGPKDEESERHTLKQETASGKIAAKTPNLSPHSSKQHRRDGSDYDGSDYGDESDMDSSGLPPGLVARMDTVESLARRGTENNGTENDGVVSRVIESLKDLGSQSGVENGASRLITAHSALSTHLLHQTRLLHSLTYPLFSPLSLPPDAEFIDDIIPLLVTISDSMPRPTTGALTSLSQLQANTADIIQTLNYLSDTLHMSRQTTTTATRRLKSARELVAEMRRDEEAKEEGERWLRRGNWSERLGARECAGVCGEVVGGFEEVCNGWRARLVAQAEAVGA